MKMRIPRHWPLLVIASPAAVAIWSGWVGLGGLAGFGMVRPLPGIFSFTLDTAITLPVGVEAYAAYAMWAWLSGQGSKSTREFARASAIGALALGCSGQVAFHLMAASRMARAPWYVTMLVACVPVVTFGFAVALTHMLLADAKAVPESASEPVPVPAARPAPRAALALVPDASADEKAKAAKKAREAWLESGGTLTDRKLAAEFGWSRTFWTPRIREWREAGA
jgi:hypothetical protein